MHPTTATPSAAVIDANALTDEDELVASGIVSLFDLLRLAAGGEEQAKEARASFARVTTLLLRSARSRERLLVAKLREEILADLAAGLPEPPPPPRVLQ